ncbi:heparan-alpha-glucosaminide N-acetyltransferase domain-containing protein [Microbacterium sediminis]|uniref:heparan-alpha-glucosaminide N-acetyltransferase domain-containing protein n=1 Tax=Microbacterium sediminis TaxID=904291 RepID=UPI000A05EE9B|nr:heparan-alpha-glucosaminide N-acetyltransferase domain-containing protein [Microbacterium sediminis]QBR74551.1 DUF1624 domain-containing protein [Microbacterium sediminis]
MTIDGAASPRTGEPAPSRLAARWRRFDGPGREAGVDLARGIAVVGMFAAHLLTTPALVWRDPGSWLGLVDGRSSILFATLAGVSLALTTGGWRGADGTDLTLARGRIALRAVCIWAWGLLLISLATPVIVILPAYAILFLLALPALRWRATRLFVVAAAIGVVVPFAIAWLNTLPMWQTPGGEVAADAIGWNYPFPLWAAFVAAGLGIGRLRLSMPLTAALLLAAGTVLAAVGYGLFGRWAAPAGPWHALSAEPHSSGVGEAIGSGGFAIAVIAACVLLCATPLRWLAIPLRAVGAMPLTAYSAQLIAWALLQPDPGATGSDLLAFRALEPFWPMTVATLVGCTAWTLLVGRGPLESGISWLARRLTPPHERSRLTP